jgi:hypothetical protein
MESYSWSRAPVFQGNQSKAALRLELSADALGLVSETPSLKLIAGTTLKFRIASWTLDMKLMALNVPKKLEFKVFPLLTLPVKLAAVAPMHRRRTHPYLRPERRPALGGRHQHQNCALYG